MAHEINPSGGNVIEPILMRSKLREEAIVEQPLYCRVLMSGTNSVIELSLNCKKSRKSCKRWELRCLLKGGKRKDEVEDTGKSG
jgi:hypothetical protein